MKLIELQGLETLVQKQNNVLKAIILFHGYGAHMGDLVPLIESVSNSHSWDWFFPNGILSMENGGRAWFPIDERLPQMLAHPEYAKLPESQHYPEGFWEALEKVNPFVEEIKKDYHQIILGGFSQGSALACELAFCRPQQVHQLVLFSTLPVAFSQWNVRANSPPPPFSIFQSHGQYDALLPIEYARLLKSFFEQMKTSLEYSEFPGGHEIPPPVLKKFDLFLQHSSLTQKSSES